MKSSAIFSKVLTYIHVLSALLTQVTHSTKHWNRLLVINCDVSSPGDVWEKYWLAIAVISRKWRMSLSGISGTKVCSPICVWAGEHLSRPGPLPLSPADAHLPLQGAERVHTLRHSSRTTPDNWIQVHILTPGWWDLTNRPYFVVEVRN